jgi:hypothetical protein
LFNGKQSPEGAQYKSDAALPIAEIMIRFFCEGLHPFAKRYRPFRAMSSGLGRKALKRHNLRAVQHSPSQIIFQHAAYFISVSHLFIKSQQYSIHPL